MESRPQWQESGVGCPLVSVQGTPAGNCDIAPHPLKERLPDAPKQNNTVKEGGGAEMEQGEG